MKGRHIQVAGDLDKAAFEITEIVRGATVLRFRKPLAITPELDAESRQWLLLEQPDLNIHVVAARREALMEELHCHIAMLWDEYAADDAGNLSPMALELRARLLAAIEEVPVALA
jgi:hypothetical protein